MSPYFGDVLLVLVPWGRGKKILVCENFFFQFSCFFHYFVFCCQAKEFLSEYLFFPSPSHFSGTTATKALSITTAFQWFVYAIYDYWTLQPYPWSILDLFIFENNRFIFRILKGKKIKKLKPTTTIIVASQRHHHHHRRRATHAYAHTT